MDPQYSIKAVYKGSIYLIQGHFFTERELKKAIIGKEIKDLAKESSFIIQYPEGIPNLSAAYKECETSGKNTFKINILKKKKAKNQSSSHQNSQNSSEALRNSISMDPPSFNLENDQNPEPQAFRRFLNQSQQNPPHQQEFANVRTIRKPERLRKTSEQEDLETQIKYQEPVSGFETKNFDSSRDLILPEHPEHEREFPNLEVSEIHERSPLEPEPQEKQTGPDQINDLKELKKDKTLTGETKTSSKQESEKYTKKCSLCSEDNILVETICLGCLEDKQQKSLQKMTKSLEESLKLKIKHQLELDIKTKLNQVEIDLKKQISQLKLKMIEQQQKILQFLDENKELKESLKISQNKAKMFEAELNKIKMLLVTFNDKFKLFEKDFHTINQINFELQNSKIALEQRIDVLAEKQAKQLDQIKSNPEFTNQEKLSAPVVLKEKIPQQKPPIVPQEKIPQLKPAPAQNTKPKNPLLDQPEIKENKPANQIPKEDLQKIFANPQFPEGKVGSQPQNKNLKPLDGVIVELGKVSILKVGETYQPRISIKNTGSSKWPGDVCILEKDSKRSKKIGPLNPNQEMVFRDDMVYKGDRDGQNIQIKYQLYFEENGERTYIGMPISNFIKVKKAKSDSRLSALEEEENEERKERELNQRINEHKGTNANKVVNEEDMSKSRIEVERYGVKSMEEVEIRKSNTFVKFINEKKKELGVGSQTTKNIKTKLENMGITQKNFEECDPGLIDEVINNLTVMDIMGSN